MRQRYIVYYKGRAVGWVHAHNPMEAIERVAAITAKPAEQCEAIAFKVRTPHPSESSG